LLCTRTNSTITQAAARVKLRGATKFFTADSALVKVNVKVSWRGKGAQVTSRPAPAHPGVAAHTTRAGHAEGSADRGMRGGKASAVRRADARPGHD
jgi:hypothetical protein